MSILAPLMDGPLMAPAPSTGETGLVALVDISGRRLLRPQPRNVVAPPADPS